MINLDFMPSRQLALYAAKLFLTRSLAVLIALVLVLMTLDLLGESSKILRVPGNGEAELWRYVSLRVPLLVSRFLPFSVLLGALIAFTGLNQHSEVVSMKAAGMSAHQILAPMIVASLGVAVALFIFNETVVIQSARTVNAWTDADYEPIPAQSDILSNVWIRDGNDLIRSRLVGGKGPATQLRGVTIYDREGGALRKVTDADRAEQVPGGWRLENWGWSPRASPWRRSIRRSGISSPFAARSTTFRPPGAPARKRAPAGGTRFRVPCRPC
jgi:lipopolysaccharide export system permease protein